jgi:hypothetical protein
MGDGAMDVMEKDRILTISHLIWTVVLRNRCMHLDPPASLGEALFPLMTLVARTFNPRCQWGAPMSFSKFIQGKKTRYRSLCMSPTDDIRAARFCFACFMNYKKMASWMMTHARDGVEPALRSGFIACCIHDHAEIARCMLANELVKLDMFDCHGGNFALAESCRKGSHDVTHLIIEWMSNGPWSENNTQSIGWGIIKCCKRGDIDLAKQLFSMLPHGAIDYGRFVPEAIAASCKTGAVDSVEWLVDSIGPQVFVPGGEFWHVFSERCIVGDMRTAKFMHKSFSIGIPGRENKPWFRRLIRQCLVSKQGDVITWLKTTFEIE